MQKLEDVLADYYSHYYAEAANPMQVYFEYLESMGRFSSSKKVVAEEKITCYLNFPEKKIHKLDELLSIGEKAANTKAVRARIHRDRICLDYLKFAWTREDAAYKAAKMKANGQIQDMVEQLKRGVMAGRACLKHLDRYQNERVFLTASADDPKGKVGHFYTRSYNEKQLTQLEAKLEKYSSSY